MISSSSTDWQRSRQRRYRVQRFVLDRQSAASTADCLQDLRAAADSLPARSARTNLASCVHRGRPAQAAENPGERGRRCADSATRRRISAIAPSSDSRRSTLRIRPSSDALVQRLRDSADHARTSQVLGERLDGSTAPVRPIRWLCRRAGVSPPCCRHERLPGPQPVNNIPRAPVWQCGSDDGGYASSTGPFPVLDDAEPLRPEGSVGGERLRRIAATPRRSRCRLTRIQAGAQPA